MSWNWNEVLPVLTVLSGAGFWLVVGLLYFRIVARKMQVGCFGFFFKLLALVGWVACWFLAIKILVTFF